MKKLVLLFSLFSFGFFYGQNKEINPDNSWFKLGLTAGLPVGDTSDFYSFTLGADVRAQFLVTPNIGVGIASGYTNFFGKDGADDFGQIPLAAFGRYYFNEAGWYVGIDLGYGFLTNVENTSGGLYINPQIGYNTYNWNFYGYFQHTSAEGDLNVQSVGIGATYNIRFK